MESSSSTAALKQLKLKHIKRKILKRKKIKKPNRKKVRILNIAKMSSSNESKPDNYQVNAKICRLIAKYPCMFDRSHVHYLKKDVVDKAWIKISKEMDDSIPSCKERWRNIRTSFARSINVNKIPSSANRTKPYYLHEELQFLAKHITPGVPVSRRSNAYLSAGEESETIEVSVGEDSFDGFAAMLHDNGEASQDNVSSMAEINDPKNGVEEEQTKPDPKLTEEQQMVEQYRQQQLVQQEQLQKQLQLQQQQLQQQLQQQEHIPMQQPMEDQEVKATAPICPPKKRHRELMESHVPEITCAREVNPIPKESNATDDDYDALFLQGILPDMRAMDFRQKLIFKRRVYEVIGDIFENSLNICSSSSNTTNARSFPTQPTAVVSTSTPPANAPASAIPLVNAADLAMIRRLNNLINTPTTPINAVPKNAAAISSTVHSFQPSISTVALHRGAITRAANAHLVRVNMSNGTVGTSSIPALQPQIVKKEPELLDDD